MGRFSDDLGSAGLVGGVDFLVSDSIERGVRVDDVVGGALSPAEGPYSKS